MAFCWGRGWKKSKAVGHIASTVRKQRDERGSLACVLPLNLPGRAPPTFRRGLTPRHVHGAVDVCTYTLPPSLPLPSLPLSLSLSLCLAERERICLKIFLKKYEQPLSLQRGPSKAAKWDNLLTAWLMVTVSPERATEPTSVLMLSQGNKPNSSKDRIHPVTGV